jgi:ubiquinone/menaquinone biosynthesis C-methylase UbiE
MKVRINYGLDVKNQWNKVWEEDTIERNQSKLDYPEYWDLYDKYIKKDGKLLEAGVGLGKWLNYFQKKDYDIVGIDYSDVAVQKLKDYDSSLNAVYGDVTDIPFDDNTFDTYLSYGVLEHLEDVNTLKKAVSEIHRVVKKDGIAYITIPNLTILNYIDFLKNKLGNNNYVRKLFGKEAVESNFFEYNYTEKEFLSYFDTDKFEICEVVPENIPLILKRFSRYTSNDKTIKNFNTNLNEKGLALWQKLLKKPNDSFVRKQLSHLLIYVIKMKGHDNLSDSFLNIPSKTL